MTRLKVPKVLDKNTWGFNICLKQDSPIQLCFYAHQSFCFVGCLYGREQLQPVLWWQFSRRGGGAVQSALNLWTIIL